MNLSASLSASLHSSFTSQKRLITYRARAA